MISKIVVCVLFLALAHVLPAGQCGPFSYTINQDKGEVTITRVSTEWVGALVIPSEIEGFPVTEIESERFWERDGDPFHDCDQITSVSIPATVVYMVTLTLQDPISLAYIDVDDANPVYGDIDGVLYDKTSNQIIRCPKAWSGSFVIPEFIESIRGGFNSEVQESG